MAAVNNSLNILVEAKKEYLHQMVSVMSPMIIETFQDLYNDAKKISKNKKVLLHYQKILKEVVNWNNHMVRQHTDAICHSCGWFNDLLAAVFVSYVKIFSSVRLNMGNKKISIKLPTNDIFIHGCYINMAKDIYKDPYVFHDDMTEYEREENLNGRLMRALEITIKDMIPVQDILKAYISQDNNTRDLDVMSEAPDDAEDPEIDEGKYELPEGASDDPEEVTPEEAPAVPDIPEAPEVQEPPEEVPGVKTIEMNKKKEEVEDDDVLFPNAPDQ
jgi:hypothetical protein